MLSLIQFRSTNRWLFAGLFESKGCTPHGEMFQYELVERPNPSIFRGRVVVDFARTFRNSYPNGETCDSKLIVHQILPEAYTIRDFPGYRKVDISKAILDAIVRAQPMSWVTALSSVAGVYLISDVKKGKLYVGSATGEGGIWQRWLSYSKSGHGGNLLLRDLLAVEGAERANDFRFSILEIADIHDSEAELLTRETHWKRLLLTRDHGLNAN